MLVLRVQFCRGSDHVIPTAPLAGLIAGGLIGERRTLMRSVVVVVVVPLRWGIIVGVAASSIAVIVGGTALALANVAVGALVGSGVRALLRAAGRPAADASMSVKR
jgi:predicted Co/Zn/Cd cation transporter (cation efflux family)